MTKLLAKYGFMAFGLLVLTVSALSYGGIATTVAADDAARAAEIQELDQRYTSREQELRTESREAYADLLGTEYSRVRRDEQIIEELLAAALTWEGHEEYVAAREEVIEEFDLSSDQHFIQTYLPPAPMTTDGEGNEFYALDVANGGAPLNSRLGGFSADVLSVVRTEYRYLVSVTAESLSNDEMEAAGNTSVVLITIDGDAQITEISGYAEDVDAPRRNSGTGFTEVATEDSEPQQ